MPIRSINNTFNQGELDPTLFARVDVDLYRKGARKLRNMIALWTGAARIAPGTSYTDVLVDRENANAIIDDASEVKGVDFLYDSDNEVVYTIILRKSNTTGTAFDIYYNNALQATVTGAPYTPAQIPNVYFAAAHDRILILHEDVQIRQLVRGASHSSWTLSTLTPSVYPTYDYSVIGKATNYRVSGFSFTLGATSGSGIALTASSGVFTAAHVGGLLLGQGGVARITAVGSTTAATVRILTTFTSTTIAGVNASLREKMWGDYSGGTPAGQNRGWPARGVFFLNRLLLGRSLELKNIVAVSTAGVFDNFDDSDVDDTTSFSVSFNGKGEQSIQSIVADDSIIFLTTNKVFAQSPLVETPLSASNVYFAPQSENASSSIEAATVDNQILYVSANKSQVVQLTYNTGDAKYLGYPAGLLSNNIFNIINSNATWEPTGISTRLYMATQENGTMLMYSTLIQQNVNAWSLRTTRGNFKQVIGDGRQGSVIVERQITLGSSTFETSMDYAYLSDPTFKAFYDATEAFSSASSSAVGVLETDNDYVVLGNDIPFTAIDITFNTGASSDCELIFEYLDGNGFWDTFTPTDNTTGFTTNGSVTWAFSDVLNWKPNDVNNIESKYWIRIQRTANTVLTTPIIEQIQVNTGIRLYLEKMSFDRYMDSVVDTTSDSNGNVTGLTHLAGQQIYCISNGATSGPFFVDSSGETTVSPLNAGVEIGLFYQPKLVPMPLLTPTTEGDNAYSQKYVQDLFIDYVDSLYLQAGIGIQFTDIPNMTLGGYTLGQSVPPQTNVYKMHPRGGWEPRQEITITQSQPGPMTIIGVGYHVEVS